MLEHNGSNSMNFAKVLVDPHRDLGVVVVTNFAPERSEKPTKEVLEVLYRRFSAAE